jgi:hypothetical protein
MGQQDVEASLTTMLVVTHPHRQGGNSDEQEREQGSGGAGDSRRMHPRSSAPSVFITTKGTQKCTRAQLQLLTAWKTRYSR